MTRRYSIGVAAVSVVASLALALPAFAQVNADVTAAVPGVSAGVNASVTGGHPDQHGQWQGNGDDQEGNGQGQEGHPGMMGMRMMGQMKPGIFGTVTAVNGTTLTVSGRAFAAPVQGQKPGMTATTTYTVDASNATVRKDNATTTLSAVAVNDRVFVTGTVSGTNVTATAINDGIGGMMGRKPGNGQGAPVSPIKGNGEPVVAGTVSSVNGSTIAITTSSGTSYTIDATSAMVTKGNATSTVASVSTGDYVVVQGTVNGSSVTASSVIDGKAQANASGQPGRGGIIDAIGQFFKHLFGF